MNITAIKTLAVLAALLLAGCQGTRLLYAPAHELNSQDARARHEEPYVTAKRLKLAQASQ